MTESAFSEDRMEIGVTTHLLESGRNRTNFMIEKWDLDQINWVRGKDYNGGRILSRGQEPVKRHFVRYKCTPAEIVLDEDCNLITAAGWALAIHTGAWLGSAGTLFSATVGRVGLGQVAAATAPTYADVALGAASGWTGGNWQLCGVAPVYTAASGGTGATMVFACTFSTAAFSTNAITEFAVDQGTAASAANTTASTAPMVDHGIIASGSYGTKTSSQTWNTTVTMTFT